MSFYRRRRERSAAARIVVDGRHHDEAYTAYVMALNEITGHRHSHQLNGIRCLVGLLGHAQEYDLDQGAPMFRRGSIPYGARANAAPQG